MSSPRFWKTRNLGFCLRTPENPRLQPWRFPPREWSRRGINSVITENSAQLGCRCQEQQWPRIRTREGRGTGGTNETNETNESTDVLHDNRDNGQMERTVKGVIGPPPPPQKQLHSSEWEQRKGATISEEWTNKVREQSNYERNAGRNSVLLSGRAGSAAICWAQWRTLERVCGVSSSLCSKMA